MMSILTILFIITPPITFTCYLLPVAVDYLLPVTCYLWLWTAGLRASSEDYVVTTRKQPREWKQLLLRPPGVRSSRS